MHLSCDRHPFTVLSDQNSLYNNHDLLNEPAVLGSELPGNWKKEHSFQEFVDLALCREMSKQSNIIQEKVFLVFIMNVRWSCI